jgi:hypothetical protein
VDRLQRRAGLRPGLVDRVSFAGEPDLLAQPLSLGLALGEIGLGLLGAALGGRDMRELVRSDTVITGFLPR